MPGTGANLKNSNSATIAAEHEASSDVTLKKLPCVLRMFRQQNCISDRCGSTAIIREMLGISQSSVSVSCRHPIVHVAVSGYGRDLRHRRQTPLLSQQATPPQRQLRATQTRAVSSEALNRALCSGSDWEEPAEGFNSISEALADLAEGKFVVVLDDESRENEGDLIMAAETMTTEAMAFMVEYTSGVICVPLEGG